MKNLINISIENTVIGTTTKIRGMKSFTYVIDLAHLLPRINTVYKF